jgi:hypothetical protein
MFGSGRRKGWRDPHGLVSLWSDFLPSFEVQCPCEQSNRINQANSRLIAYRKRLELTHVLSRCSNCKAAVLTFSDDCLEFGLTSGLPIDTPPLVAVEVQKRYEVYLENCAYERQDLALRRRIVRSGPRGGPDGHRAA